MTSFSKKDVLSALGIESESNWMPTALAGFGVGCIVGAAVAMLLAPKSGRELRQDIAQTGRDLYAKGKDFVGKGEDRMGDPLTKNNPTY